MKRLRILRMILKQTHADRILLSFILFILVDALVIFLAEGNIRYVDALWYCYQVISTIGFGDVLTTTFISKICSVLLTVYSLFVIAIVTGVVVSFYTEISKMRQKETITAFMDKLERLPELTEEELKAISEKVKRIK